MKPEELRLKYIELRAEGKSYTAISVELNINRSTCYSWEKDLSEQIAEAKRARLQELVESFAMTKEARIQRLGSTLEKINEALEVADFTQIPTEKLLDLKLKYTEALRNEQISLQPTLKVGRNTPNAVLEAYEDLYNRARSGEVSKEQAEKENTILTGLLKSHEAAELQAKVESLEAVVGGNAPVRERKAK